MTARVLALGLSFIAVGFPLDQFRLFAPLLVFISLGRISFSKESSALIVFL